MLRTSVLSGNAGCTPASPETIQNIARNLGLPFILPTVSDAAFQLSLEDKAQEPVDGYSPIGIACKRLKEDNSQMVILAIEADCEAYGENGNRLLGPHVVPSSKGVAMLSGRQVTISSEAARPGYIVTPRRGKKRLQGDGVEQEYFGRDEWRFESQEVGGALVAPGTNLARGIVPELVGGGFGEEISFGGKDLGIE